jgi:hypothetical protein
MSYLSELVSGKITPQEFLEKGTKWLKESRIPSAWKFWAIEALERLLVARGFPAFVAELITNELREAIGAPSSLPPPGG